MADCAWENGHIQVVHGREIGPAGTTEIAGTRLVCAYGVLQESSAARADENAIWDTLRSRKPGSPGGDAKPVRDLMRDLERVNRGEP